MILDKNKIEKYSTLFRSNKKFKDPLGKVISNGKRPMVLDYNKISIPIGVIGVIYESRPDVTPNVSALCIKSGNVAILKGGSEAYFSNKILSNLFKVSLKKNNTDPNCIQFINLRIRKVVDYLLSEMSDYIDVIVPRGGKSLVGKVKKLSKVSVIGHLEGNCHVYVDKDSSLEMAKKVVINSKMRRTSICGAAETLLIDRRCLRSHGIPIIEELIFSGCEIVADKKINKLFGNT